MVGADGKTSIAMGAQLASKGLDRQEVEETLGRAGWTDPANEFSVALWALWLHQTSR